jgi:peptidyl-prolyl cis-trans isomerase C
MQVALARFTLRELLDAARKAGPITDAELYDATQFHWLDMDRPAGFRTVHAVVRLDDKADAAHQKDAAAIAAAIRRALEPLAAAPAPAPSAPPPSSQPSQGAAPNDPAETDPLVEQFKQAAGAVPHEGFNVAIEALPPVAEDGRVLEPGGQAFDPDFARAAAALERRGELSQPTVTSFGVHVIMLLERTPPRSLPADERRARLQEETVVARARASQRKLLPRARDEEGVVVDRGVDALLALVAVDQ